MKRTRLIKTLKLAGALLLAFIAVSMLFMGCGQRYITLYVPSISAMIETVKPHYHVFDFHVGHRWSELYVDVYKMIRQQDQWLRARRAFSSKIDTAAFYIVPIIMFSLILAWPGLKLSQRVLSICMAVLLIPLITLADVPFVLIWEIEDQLAAESPEALKTISLTSTIDIQARVQNDKLLSFWYVFLQTGGRQFLALVGCMLCLSPFLLDMSWSADARLAASSGAGKKTVERNAPCPCGSDRKYKNCCMKK